jgi:hypothetical protein
MQRRSPAHEVSCCQGVHALENVSAVNWAHSNSQIAFCKRPSLALRSGVAVN